MSLAASNAEPDFAQWFSVPKLRKTCDPYKYGLWTDAPLTQAAVSRAIREGRLRADSWSASHSEWSWEEHVERVAYLVANPDPKPLYVDVGIPSLGYHANWPIQDGNHRFAAAIYRRDTRILVEAAGSCALIKKFLCPQVQPVALPA